MPYPRVCVYCKRTIMTSTYGLLEHVRKCRDRLTAEQAAKSAARKIPDTRPKQNSWDWDRFFLCLSNMYVSYKFERISCICPDQSACVECMNRWMQRVMRSVPRICGTLWCLFHTRSRAINAVSKTRSGVMCRNIHVDHIQTCPDGNPRGFPLGLVVSNAIST